MTFRLVLLLCSFAAAFAQIGNAQSTTVTLQGEALSADLKRDLTSALMEEPVPETLFEARRQARSAAARLEDYLNSRGYFAAALTPRVDPGTPPLPIVEVDPGPRFSLGEISLTFQGTPPNQAAQTDARAAVRGQAGDFALPDDVIADERRLVASLKSSGYAYAEAEARDVLGDEIDATIDVVYRIHAGPRIRLGNVQFGSGLRTRRAYAQRIIPFELGDIYTPEALAELNRRLGATQLYSVYAARLSDDVADVTPEGDEVRDVILTLVERDRYTISAGASFSTDEGGGLTVEWTRRNASRRGDRLTVGATTAVQERGIDVEWRLPHAFGYGRTLSFNGAAGREETDAFDRDGVILGTALDIEYSPRVNFTFGGASEFTRETDTSGERDLQIFSVSGATLLDYSSDLLDPTSGWRLSGRVEPGTAIGDNASNFVSLTSQASFYQSLFSSERWVVAGRVESGIVSGAEALDLPTSRRFFAGGGGSARGFAYQSIGPKDEDGQPVGGRGLFETSAELRWRRSETLGFAAFVDGASVSSRDVPDLSSLRYGAGLGVRYFTAIGPLRFDLATPLDREDGEDPVQIYISIGQAF
ncbi:MAG: BamA/TamA family outer membrane protein [Henriciella sp.]|nr:BamA/TamA family outer membrane protein [Henriciella sp.]